MSRDPGTTELTTVFSGNQVSTEFTAPWQCVSGHGHGVRRQGARRGTWQAASDECGGAGSGGPKIPGSARHRRIGGNQVAASGGGSTPQAWKPGFHGAQRGHRGALGAGTIWRVGGNQVSTALATTARQPCIGDKLERGGVCPVACRVPAGEGSRAFRTSPPAHRRNGGNQVSTDARASTPKAWKPGFHGAWRVPLVRLDTGARPARRNVRGNQVSTPLEIQHG
ncbi:hypothetical protein J2W96_007321 [Variovorax guangxiensis]|nr:hypothetical protein [Variovorax guangxiensis]